MLFVFAAAVANAAPDLVVGNAAVSTFACEADQNVKIEGNALTLTFTGDCGKLEVIGNNNVVTIDGVTAIRLTGNKNKATWSRNRSSAPALEVTKLGVGNKVVQAK